MATYESGDLFRAMSDARERAAGVTADLHEGVEELLTIALLAGIVPDRVDRLTDVTVDCAPDVRPVIGALIASLVARPRNQQRQIVETSRKLLDSVNPNEDAFAGITWESFRDG
jgi:hypothetical protein